MLHRLGQFGVMIVATLFIWFSVAMVDVISARSWMTDAAVVLAFLCTISIWVVQGLDAVGSSTQQPKQREKAKRHAPTEDDARLALLLHLMDEDERARLRQQLMDDLNADGEAVPLADLLAAQEDREPFMS